MNNQLDILILPGDGIGPEITDVVEAALAALDARHRLGLRLTRMQVGLAAHARHGSTLPDAVVAAARAADGIVLGPAEMTSYPPREQGGISVPGTLRKALDLYANIRPARSRPGLPQPPAPMDLVIYRENTEGFYADRNMFAGIAEFMPTEDVALSVRKITRHASRRIARAAFEAARARRRHVAIVQKKHVLQLTDGLFVGEAEAMAREYPDVTLDSVTVDAMAAALYRFPDRFDVVLTSNMFGDILSNLTAEMSGGLGLSAALNAGDGHAAANAGHGSAPDIAGQDKANPCSLLLSSAMLLDWLARRRGRDDLAAAAHALEAAVDTLLESPATRTRDVGGTLGTRAFGAALLAKLA
jgi:isocitrate/isopropylmalate dehydrogenase